MDEVSWQERIAMPADSGKGSGIRLFAIQGYGEYFYAGVVSDGRQVLMGLLIPNLVAYFFSSDGVLLNRDTRPLEYPPPRQGGTGPYQTEDRAFRDHLAHQFLQWQEELGFRPQTIHVRAFIGFGRDTVGIEEAPDYLITPDKDEDTEERELRERSLAEWRKVGNFVLWWSNGFYMTKDGEVESS